ncbi:stage III sporulation protein SpoAB [Anaerobacillus alkalidiazotrophicus]|uniref:Stage III sporulation protein SpoAB n=1 Tax=Anaerobacillus alkalidiazotrophicus TaxID=472963 RepID=A0A1S2M6D7_9BACI|nr:stage III sporulation protein SpoIIIAB [Anaerobacillus alkalidiazotrophicus]OIJ20298.1 stage III sporulation protein SpoAB [Anaerobacillus alkalidiazotrophicus]
MKILGAILIIVATTWVGFEFARRLSDRPRQLRQLKVALQSLESEIMYGLTPLSEASKHIAKQMPKPISYFFQSFAERLNKGEVSVHKAWEESLNDTWHMTALCKGELEVMSQFGATLGQHDREHQQKQIRLTLSHLEREEGDAIEAQNRYEKMLKSLGFLTGLLIVILMM